MLCTVLLIVSYYIGQDTVADEAFIGVTEDGCSVHWTAIYVQCVKVQQWRVNNDLD